MIQKSLICLICFLIYSNQVLSQINKIPSTIITYKNTIEFELVAKDIRKIKDSIFIFVDDTLKHSIILDNKASLKSFLIKKNDKDKIRLKIKSKIYEERPNNSNFKIKVKNVFKRDIEETIYLQKGKEKIYNIEFRLDTYEVEKTIKMKVDSIEIGFVGRLPNNNTKDTSKVEIEDLQISEIYILNSLLNTEKLRNIKGKEVRNVYKRKGTKSSFKLYLKNFEKQDKKIRVYFKQQGYPDAEQILTFKPKKYKYIILTINLIE